MELEQIAKGVTFTHPKATVLEVAERMTAEHIRAMVVLDDGLLVGIVSERDIVGRVVAKRRAPESTLVSEIMTTHVQTVAAGASEEEALDRMHRGQCHHLPLVDRAGRVIGMLGIRDLLRDRIEELALKNADLVGFISIDGPGG